MMILFVYIYVSSCFCKGGIFISIYQTILAEHERLHKEITAIEAQLQTLPDGNLLYMHNGNYTKWYVSQEGSRTYIPKNKLDFAQNLARKKYLLQLCNSLQHEMHAIEYYLRHHKADTRTPEEILLSLPEYQELLSPCFTPLSAELADWAQSSFKSNPHYLDQLLHKTLSGHTVRSKSESLIDTLLFLKKIPFRYESALVLDDVLFYPDFTIRHPETGAYYYWEHFGLMDDPSYARNAAGKLQLYFSNGIIPTINLIITYETKTNPLSSELVEKIIAHYFEAFT